MSGKQVSWKPQCPSVRERMFELRVAHFIYRDRELQYKCMDNIEIDNNFLIYSGVCEPLKLRREDLTKSRVDKF